MIRKKSEYTHEERTAMRGGDGTIKFEHVWKKSNDMHSNTRMYSKLIIEPGCSIGYHVHENEEESFFILQGRAEVDDNGVKKVLETGDGMLTRSGEGHSIAALGDETLIVLAVIACY